MLYIIIPMAYRWYVVQTKSKKEDFVTNILNKADFDVFNPKIKEKNTTKPLFPGYIFVYVDLNKPLNYRKIKYAMGVRKILGNDHTPIPIDDQVIYIIREKMDEHGIVKIGPSLIPGDKVRVRDGLLRDLIGILETPVSDRGRVKILLTLVNYSARIVLDPSNLEKI